MSYRRRHRWFPRLALGLAVASVMFVGRASVAAAKVDEGTSAAQQIQVIPYLSHGILTQADADVAAAAAQPQKPRLNPYISLWMARDYSAWQQHPQQTPYMSLGMSTYGTSRELPEPFVDDKVDVPVRPGRPSPTVSRHSDVASQVEPTNGDNWRLEWNGRAAARHRHHRPRNRPRPGARPSAPAWDRRPLVHRAGTPEAGSTEPAFACVDLTES